MQKMSAFGTYSLCIITSEFILSGKSGSSKSKSNPAWRKADWFCTTPVLLSRHLIRFWQYVCFSQRVPMWYHIPLLSARSWVHERFRNHMGFDRNVICIYATNSIVSTPFEFNKSTILGLIWEEDMESWSIIELCGLQGRKIFLCCSRMELQLFPIVIKNAVAVIESCLGGN